MDFAFISFKEYNFKWSQKLNLFSLILLNGQFFSFILGYINAFIDLYSAIIKDLILWSI